MKPWKLTIYQYANGMIATCDDTEQQVPDFCGPAPTILPRLILHLMGKLNEHEYQQDIAFDNKAIGGRVIRQVAYCWVCLGIDDTKNNPMIMVEDHKGPLHQWVHKKCGTTAGENYEMEKEKEKDA